MTDKLPVTFEQDELHRCTVINMAAAKIALEAKRIAREADLIAFAKTGAPKVEFARWPGGIDDLEF